MKVFHHNFLNKMRSLFAFNAKAKKKLEAQTPTHKGRSSPFRQQADVIPAYTYILFWYTHSQCHHLSSSFFFPLHFHNLLSCAKRIAYIHAYGIPSSSCVLASDHEAYAYAARSLHNLFLQMEICKLTVIRCMMAKTRNASEKCALHYFIVDGTQTRNCKLCS